MFYSGTQGQMFIDGDKAGKVRSWSFTPAWPAGYHHVGRHRCHLNARHSDEHRQPLAVLLRPGGWHRYVNSGSTLINKLLKAKATGGDPGQGVKRKR